MTAYRTTEDLLLHLFSEETFVQDRVKILQDEIDRLIATAVREARLAALVEAAGADCAACAGLDVRCESEPFRNEVWSSWYHKSKDRARPTPCEASGVRDLIAKDAA